MATAAEIQAKLDALSANMDRFNNVVNGDETTDVTTTGGIVPSIAKFFAEASIAINFRGGWDASSGSFPSGSSAGDTYLVTDAGTVNGVTFAVNDSLVALVDAASTSVFAANWIRTDLSVALAPIDSPTFTGEVTLPEPTDPDHAARLSDADAAASIIADVIGVGSVSVNSTVGSGNYAQDDPVQYTGLVKELRIATAASGTVTFRVLSKSGRNFAVTHDVEIAVPGSGTHTFKAPGDFTAFEMAAGQYLGIYQPSAVLCRVGETGLGFYNFGGDDTDILLTDAASQTNVTLQYGATIKTSAGDRALTSAQGLDARLSAAEPDVAASRPALWLGVQGEGDLITARGNSPDRQVIPAYSSPFNGTLNRITLEAKTVGSVTVRAMTRSGPGDFVQTASTTFNIPTGGRQTFVAGTDFTTIPVVAGQYLAIAVPDGLLGQDTSEGIWVYLADDNMATSFTDPAAQNNVGFQIGFEVLSSETLPVGDTGPIMSADGFHFAKPHGNVLTGDFGYGQSWMGNNGTSLEADIMKPAYFPNNALMFLDFLKSESGPASDLEFAPLRGNDEDPTLTGPMGNRIVHDSLRRGINKVNLTFQLGIGGQSLNALTSPDFAYHTGETWYENLLLTVTRATAVAAKFGCQFELSTVVWIQGAGGPAGYTQYRDRFTEFVDVLQEDVLTETGQQKPPTVLVIQPPSGADNIQSQADVAAGRGDVVLAVAGWGYQKIDGLHFDAEGCIQIGELLGIARQHIDEGRPWSAPYLRNVTRSGTTITAYVGGPFPVLADTTTDLPANQIPDTLGTSYTPVPNLGFTYSGANITSVTVEPFKVTIELDADAAGTLAFAFNNNGNNTDDQGPHRGCLRADATWASVWASDDLRLWMANGYWEL